MASGSEAALQNNQAATAAEEFHKLYYDTFDKRRNLLSKLYMDTATMVWNGNPKKGSSEIIDFLDKLPSSEHTIDLLDCQAIPDSATKGQTSIVVITGGNVKFQGNKKFPFNENFILTSQDGKWKIASNCFRYQE